MATTAAEPKIFNETLTIVLALLALMMPLFSVLIATLYKNMKTNIADIVAEAEVNRIELWTAVNKALDMGHRLDRDHNGWCQKHESSLNQHTRDIRELKESMKTYKYATGELDARVRLIDGKNSAIVRP
jgi:hypothetical protein